MDKTNVAVVDERMVDLNKLVLLVEDKNSKMYIAPVSKRLYSVSIKYGINPVKITKVTEYLKILIVDNRFDELEKWVNALREHGIDFEEA